MVSQGVMEVMGLLATARSPLLHWGIGNCCSRVQFADVSGACFLQRTSGGNGRGVTKSVVHTRCISAVTEGPPRLEGGVDRGADEENCKASTSSGEVYNGASLRNRQKSQYSARTSVSGKQYCRMFE
ncbi:hypothetical protein R1flu_012021 [Riccia fluitans]|uniref:Uncharacterized protein n=1 Tax=Riccia fluitans TaxID=41844 RepID=A0ABD1ZBX6_9MARC